MSVTVDDMRDRLLSMDQVRERLAATEPLSCLPFQVGNAVRFVLDPAWAHGLAAKQDYEAVNAQIVLGKGAGAKAIPLSKSAILTAAHKSGAAPLIAEKLPARLLEDQLNFFFRQYGVPLGGTGRIARNFQVTVMNGLAVTISKFGLVPLSNLKLLDTALAGIAAVYGDGEVLADFKFHHDPSLTRLRLVVPAHQRTITGTDVDEDVWSVGVQINSSLTGTDAVRVDGYLFRWWCTNGAIDTRASAGQQQLRRRKGIDEKLNPRKEVVGYEWMRAAVDTVLSDLDASLDRVQQMTHVQIEDNPADVLRDIFAHYKVALPERTKIIEAVANTTGPLTMYALMAAVTETANASQLGHSAVERLLRLGGELPHAETSRCDACRRLLH